MTTGELLVRLDRAGIRLRAEAGRLLYDAPAGALTPELRESLKRHKAELIARLGSGTSPAALPGAETAVSTAVETAVEIGAPLSFPQQGLWLLEEIQPGHTGSSEQFVLGLKGALDVAALARAWSHLLARHDILRTRFRRTPAGVRQFAAPADPRDPVPLLPVTPLAEAGELVAAAARELLTPFDPARGPLVRPRLFRRGPADHVLVVTAHHAVADGFSVPVLHRELAALYGEAVTREPAMLPPVRVQYARFAADAVVTRDDGDRARRLAAWCDRLGDLPPPVLGGLVRPAPLPGGQPVSRRVTFTVPPALAVAVRRFARARNATPFMVMLAAFRALLARLSGQADLVIGTPLTLRDRPELREAVGCYVNPVALRAVADPDGDFGALVDRERATVLAALEDRHLPFADVVAAVAPERRVGEHPLFQVLFSLEQDSAGECRAAGVAFRRESVAAERASWFQLELNLVEAAGGEGYTGSLAWNESVLEDFVATGLPARWLALLADALECSTAPLHSLALMTTDERRQVLEGWNDTAAPWPGRDNGTDTLHAQVLRQCAATPAAPALLATDQSVLLRYGELATLSGTLARRLREQGITPGTPVGLALPRSPELVVAWLALLRAGAVAVPLDPGYPAERLRYIAADAGLDLVLTVARGQNPVHGLPAGLSAELPVAAVSLDDLVADVSAHVFGEVPPDAAGPGDPVCIFYTSGSTGVPKGAVQHHRGAVNRCHWMWSTFGFDAGHRFALRTSPNFVDSLWEIFGALMHGIPLVVIPDEVATDPVALPAALAAGGVTHTVLVPALLRALLEAGGARHLGGLRSAITSGEPLTPSLARQLRAALPGLTLFNTYGTSEIWDATCHVVTAADGAGSRVPIGRPIANVRCHVLDARGQPLPPGVPGELWVGGVGVGPGYWRQPALTAERFLPDPFCIDAVPGPADGEVAPRLYRTGDLARWLPDGTLECLGRLDGQVKLRGHRIELAEIESALLAQPGVAAAAVTLVAGEGREGPGDGWLLAAVVGRETLVSAAEIQLAADIKARLRRSLPEFMVPAVIAWLPRLPLTPSGKVDRRALPALVGALPSTDQRDDDGGPPATPLEQRLAGTWCELLGREQVGRHANFFDLGGHSLIASRLVQRLGPVLAAYFGPDTHINLGLRDVFTHPTLADLARMLESRAGSASGEQGGDGPARLTASASPSLSASVSAPAPSPASGMAPADAVPLSFSQERLWFLDQLDPASPAYNIAWTVRLSGHLDQALLRRCLEILASRHDALRMAFPSRNGEPVAVIRPAGDFCRNLPLEVVDAVTGAVADVDALLAERARQPFSLATGPLVRFVLVPDGPAGNAPGAHILLVVIHHIVSDATANHLLFGELAACYQAGLAGREPSLPPLPFRYADYAAWQRRRPWPAADLAWWQEQLAGAPEALDLPTDRPRPAEQKFRGGWVTRRLGADRAAALRALGRDHGTSLFPVLLAAFQVLLHRWSGNTDILTGTPVEGRAFAGGEQLVGLFINTVVIRTDLAGDPAFAVLLDQVRDRALAAQARQGLPFEQLVEALAPTRSLSRSPVFQVLFNLIRLPERGRTVGVGPEALTLSLDRLVDLGVSPFDLTLTAAEHREGLDLVFEYDTDLFDAGTVEAFADQFDTLMGAVLEDPATPVSRLRLLAPAETARLDRWSGRAALPAPAALDAVPPVLEGIRHWCRAQPDAPAVSELEGETLSYGGLEHRSAGLARWLRDQGLGTGHRIGICLPRSPAYLVAVLGVLRAGAAYVPLDPDYPAARREFMAKDAELALVLDGDAVEAGVRAGQLLPAADLPMPAASDAAYLVYTSGSTGEPKGVVVSHGNLAALAAAWRKVYGLEPGEAHLQMASAAFDVFAGDWTRALTSGGELVVCPREVLLEPAVLHRTLVDRRIRVAEFVPAVIRELLAWLAGRGARLPALRLVAVGSDTWTLAEYRALVRACGPGCRVVNSYGVAEATVDSTVFEVDPGDADLPDRLGDGPVPIGRPFPGVVVDVRDDHGQPVPPGVPGELWIGGAGVAAGYHRRPVLTAERFVTDGAGRRWYRTGDRARWRADGLLELRGRLDAQLKLRGQRIEPGEIEGALRSLPGIADAAVVLAYAERPAEARLVAWLVRSGADATPFTPAEEDALARALRARLPAHLVPARIAVLTALPLSPNGKVDRLALASRPLPPLPVDVAAASSLSPVEDRLARLFADALGRPVPGPHADFFALGGHSLLATRLVARIREAFHADLPLKAFFEAPTVAGIAAWLEAHGDAADAAVPVPRPPGTDRLPLSLAQQRLWFLEQLKPGGSAWHLHQALGLPGLPDTRALQAAVAELLARHESLRTVFETVEGVPVQRVLAPEALASSVLRVEARRAGTDEEDLRAITGEPFDLARGPLWRVVVLRLPEQGDATLLVLVIHHLIADGWSLGVLFRELSAGYRRALEPPSKSKPLPALSLQFGDWALWQRQWLAGGEGARQLDYWRRQLADAPPPLELWGARSRPDGDAGYDGDGIGPGRGSWHTVKLPGELLASLRTLAAAEGCTLFNVLLAGFSLVLGRYAGREDLLVGTPVAGRQHTALEGLIGCFVNTLPLRTDLRGNPTVAALLDRVKATAVAAFAHQDLPFEKLVEALNPVRSLRHSPLVQVQLAFHNQPRESLDLAGLAGETVFLQGDAVKFDLGVHVAEEADGLIVAVGYREALYTAGWARAFAARYTEVLAALGESGCRDTGRIRVAELGLPPANVPANVLANAPAGALPRPAPAGTLTAAFAERLAECPEALAVQDGQGAWTYSELAARAGGLQAALRNSGVMPGDRVGLVVSHGCGAVAALLGVLAAGAVAVPLDPAAPLARRRAQVSDAGVKRLVVAGDGAHQWDADDPPRLVLDSLATAAFEPVPVAPEQLAYLLYTSGTTGAPKAVAQSHGHATGWFRRWAANLAIGPGDRLSLCATLGYDAALQDLFGALLAGASVHPLDVRGQGAGELRERLRREGVTVFHATPTVFRYLFGGADDGVDLHALGTVVLGGEAARVDDLALARRRLPHARFVNGYGLTEATAVLQWFAPVGTGEEGADGEATEGTGLLPVGRPLPGVTVSLEDGDGGPATVAGELVIHGGGVTPGYWDGPASGPRPRARGERFATGDRMRRLPDGQWLWLGRNDDQVKVAGNRLALGEVEAALTACPGVAQACALLAADTLVAAVTGTADEAELRSWLRARLPAWALPARILALASLPVLPNGKVDRQALKADLATALPGASPTGGEPAGDHGIGTGPLPPDTGTLLELWQQLLPGAALDPDTDFFAAGGHSLLAMSLVARIRDRFGVELPLIRIFEAPTVRGLAMALAAARATPAGAGPGPIRRLGRRGRQ